ncbi:hypothetical protein XbC2_37 [Xanthomonas phage XbC2]|nr:hypothetical protein XbC2_37 [Xanthomonas phage XbC2]
MLQTINFQYTLITHLRELYLKMFPNIETLKTAGYGSTFAYRTTKYYPAFGSSVTCNIVVNYDNANLSFHGDRLYKSNSEQLVSMTTHEQRPQLISTYDGHSLRTVPNAENPYYFMKGNHPTKVFEMLHENDPEELEVMEFMLMSKYGMVDLTAILLNQVLINEDVGIQKYTINLPPFVGLGEERESALNDLYYSTVLGLEHEASKVG